LECYCDGSHNACYFKETTLFNENLIARCPPKNMGTGILLTTSTLVFSVISISLSFYCQSAVSKSVHLSLSPATHSHTQKAKETAESLQTHSQAAQEKKPMPCIKTPGNSQRIYKSSWPNSLHIMPNFSIINPHLK